MGTNPLSKSTRQKRTQVDKNPKKKQKQTINNKAGMDLVTKHLTKEPHDWVTFSSHCQRTTVIIGMMKPCQSFIEQEKHPKKGREKRNKGARIKVQASKQASSPNEADHNEERETI